MAITLNMDPRTPPKTWKEFCAKSPPYSIAIDGYVVGGPRFNHNGPFANFNHHEGVDRLATRATCGQVLMAIRQGLFDCFKDDNGGPCAIVHANDCDEDVCVSYFLLKHPHLVSHVMNPMINRLVTIEDALDTTAGAYPYPKDMPALQDMAWIFEPYRLFRLSGQLDKKDPAAHASIVEDVSHRIMLHTMGRGKQLPLDTRYKRIGGGKNWTMIKEIGAQGRTGAFSDGIRAYVSVRERDNGRYTYTVGRMSPFIMFDVPAIIAKLNELEGTAGKPDCWGCGNNIGGSPRVSGSGLSIEQVANVIEGISH